MSSEASRDLLNAIMAAGDGVFNDDPCLCCGRLAEDRRIGYDPWAGRLDGYCTRCALVRCDAFPGECERERTMNCAQCGLPIGDRWYRTKLDDGTVWHTDCQMGMWRSINDLERGRQLAKYSRLVMPTGGWPKNLGLPGRAR